MLLYLDINYLSFIKRQKIHHEEEVKKVPKQMSFPVLLIILSAPSLHFCNIGSHLKMSDIYLALTIQLIIAPFVPEPAMSTFSRMLLGQISRSIKLGWKSPESWCSTENVVVRFLQLWWQKPRVTWTGSLLQAGPRPSADYGPANTASTGAYKSLPLKSGCH